VVEAVRTKKPRREYWVGLPTVKAIIAQKFIPGTLDRYLAKNAYDSQQLMDQRRGPEDPDNLYTYVPGRHSARGKFDARAKKCSAQIALTLYPKWFALGAGVIAIMGALMVTQKKV
jgi:hypothetical protein